MKKKTSIHTIAFMLSASEISVSFSNILHVSPLALVYPTFDYTRYINLVFLVQIVDITNEYT